MLRRLIAVLAVFAAIFAFGSPQAWADGPTVKTKSSSAKLISNGDNFRICDLDADGNKVYVRFSYKNAPIQKIYNTAGSQTCVTKHIGNVPEGSLVFYKSCVDDFPPDTCSKQVTGRA